MAIAKKKDDLEIKVVEIVSRKGDATWYDRYARIEGLAEQMFQLILPSCPNVRVSIEGYAFGKYTRPYTLGELKQSLLNRLLECVPQRYISVVAPTSLKKHASGKGNDSKVEVIKAMTRRWPTLSTLGKDHNAFDAVALLIYGMSLQWEA